MDVNYLAILVAAVINMAIGAAWYSPILFAKPWMRLIGKSESELKKGMGRSYGLTFVTALVLAYVLAVMLNLMAVQDIAGALKMGFWIWLGFVATTNMPDYIFSGRPFKLYQINVGYYLVAILVMSVVLTVWK